jgi:hypothetical protein
MESVVICNSEKAFAKCCDDNGIEPNKAYIVCNHSDLIFAKRNLKNCRYTVNLASDWRDSGIKDDEVNDLILES